MKFGRGGRPQNGATGVLCTLLNTTNTLLRGSGVMLALEPCIALHSKNVTEPASPVGAAMPKSRTSWVRLTSSGTPISCCRSDAW